MKALSLQEKQAYIAGVIKGDGFCTNYIGLLVADKDFAEAFCDAINHVFQLSVRVRQENIKYWCVKTSNLTGKFSYLRTLKSTTQGEKASWLRGFFDSEGNVLIHKLPTGERCYERRIAMYNTNIDTLNTASSYLDALGMSSHIRAMKNGEGHWGTKVVYELRLRCSKENFDLFRTSIGSNIARKQKVIEAIPSTYSLLSHKEYSRKAQIKGAAVKRKKTLENTLPLVVAHIKTLIDSGTKPTLRLCAATIPGYSTLLGRYMRHNQMVMMARGEV
jgi:intein-encoded DNA endonuclease-like protein